MPLQRLPLQSSSPAAALPEGSMSLAGLPVLRAPLDLKLAAQAAPADGQLVLVVGLDCRYEAAVELSAPWAGWRTRVDASFVSVAQRLYIDVPGAVLAGLNRESLSLAVQAEAPLHFIAPTADAPGLTPQILQGRADDPAAAALDRLAEGAVAPFGWMGGCVADALQVLHRATGEARYLAALDAFFARYLHGSDLVHDNPRSVRLVNELETIEASLPIAALARRHPEHPALACATRLWAQKRKPDGTVRDHSDTAEACYTVAYPMLVLGAQRGDADLIEGAWRQLRRRREVLVHEGDLYLRHHEGNRGFRNWTRGICWYLLGLTRTLLAAREAGLELPEDLRAHLAERAEWIAVRQRTDGLWDNFLDEDGPPPDTSGSCGIAAALTLASKAGLIERAFRPLAQRTFAGASERLRPDGYLGGVAPNNKRGEEHQHTDRRTCEPFALGLFGQLAAALR
ncbi:MAG: glycoside hydrolase family 88 protein [Planctomycetes bacterium]|nr:glycoside hydrolase family 88 protein [Planctomycetota bacterium]